MKFSRVRPLHRGAGRAVVLEGRRWFSSLPLLSLTIGSRPASKRRTAGRSISTEPRINDRILAPKVRLVGPSGDELGIVQIETALQLARDAELDLVEVAPIARPPVAQRMDYGKVRDQADRAAEQRRQNEIDNLIKEIKDGEWQ